MKTTLTLLSLASLLTVSSAVAETFDFSTPLILSPTEAPGAWYVDRYAPNGFASQATAPDGTINTLQETISPTDHQDTSVTSFYDTQGRKYDLDPGTVSTSVSLYVTAAMASADAREAGFWTTGLDSSNAVSDYPIIEFQGAMTDGLYANSGVAGFYGWNLVTGSWNLITTGFTDGWNNLSITLDGSQVDYTADGTTISTGETNPADPEVSIGNAMLQGYNGDNGSPLLTSPYSIYWNDLSASPSASPEPGTMALIGFGLAGLGLLRRKRRV